MSQRLLLSLTLWASCSPGNAGTAALSQPRVRCLASRYPVAVDCSWTPLGAPNSTMATSFIATYRLGVAAQQQSRPCLQPNPQATRCIIPHVHLFSMVPHMLNVMAVHPSRGLLAFVAEQIIKPDLSTPALPAHGLGRHTAGQSLQVPWHPPASWLFSDMFSLKYRIWYHGASHFNQMGPIEATTFILRATQPHAKYLVQVSAQDLMDYGKPSDWSLPGQVERMPQNP
ncbi:interleukin-27 subunit beta-like [Peromyscus eremicus]|uniref:interleukin-27 subunit beta-like n=1 Tax=Peromyscus eremicus TaxID=42410 RepID=UPI0027DBD0C1|nr:interleukin-27 subunit beta-like [Peromyscus eremicus]